jgi:hypothetical protein
VDVFKYTVEQHVLLYKPYLKCGCGRKCWRKFHCKFLITVPSITGSAIFLKRVGSGTHRVTQNLVSEEEVLVISMPGKRHSGTPFRLCPSEKELPEWRSGTEVLLTTGIHELIKKAC